MQHAAAPPTDWPTTVEELEARQTELSQRLVELWHPPRDRPFLVAGAFVCSGRGRTGPGAAGDRSWASAALLEGSRLLEVQTLQGPAQAPFISGALALREGPLLQAALARLSSRPDVIFVDASGRDHPRRAGLALHLGAVLDIPSIGVTRRPLLAEGSLPADTERASRSPLKLHDQIVGYWLHTRAGVRPLCVHAAWRTDPELAVELTLACTVTSRTPEPIRHARRAARQARAGI
jgi:deoxyribonuclease V